ncbi:ROK family protein [Cohnella cholangitidis]|uniref:ROK family protein n=1 Tax=Cohnella cholangitidis TaxID=2598458 RepID=A0A7G5C494_9BACL|nr:ROK family protein [Cohnella cholangitidis]QMV44028.1 ROK family protein [Cohnella cholangitidis]
MKRNDAQPTQAEQLYGVGVDIGGTKIMITIANQAGDIMYKKKMNTSGDIDVISMHITECLIAAAISMDQVAAIGFGVPGIANSEEGTVIEAPALQWNHVPFREQMQRYFDKPIFVDNDVNCAALGERWLGSARNTNDFVVVAIGTGVGSAIIANGSLVKGSNYMAGEVAYMVMEQDVLDNGINAFGDFGQFEKKISGVALSQYGTLPQELFEQYARGDEKSIPIIQQFVTDLSIGIANMVSMLNPQKVILCGGVSQSLSGVLELIRSTVSNFTPIPTMIELTSIGEEAGAIGAAALALEKVGLIN